MKKLITVFMMLFMLMIPIQSVSATVYQTPLVTSIQPYVRDSSLGYFWSSPSVVCATYNYPSKNIQITTSKTKSNPIIKITKAPFNWRSQSKTITIPAKPSTPKPTPTPTPKPTPTPTPAPENNADFSAMQTEMLGYINAERAKVNAAPLTLDKDLCDGAALKVQRYGRQRVFLVIHLQPMAARLI